MGNTILTMYMSHRLMSCSGYDRPTQTTENVKTKEVTYNFNPQNADKPKLTSIPEEEQLIPKSPQQSPISSSE